MLAGRRDIRCSFFVLEAVIRFAVRASHMWVLEVVTQRVAHDLGSLYIEPAGA